MTEQSPEEKALLAEIEEAKSRITDTRDLYRWVCSLLFFRYGITPTTNRLYTLVRKGSMQTVTTSLAAFWADLREKSRVKIDNPAVPSELISATSELVQAVWERANVEAKAFYHSAIAEAQGQVDVVKGLHQEAENRTAAAEAALASTSADLAALQDSFAQMSDKLAAVQATLDEERGRHGATVARLEEARAEVIALRQSVSDARRDFANELEKARSAAKDEEERGAATERRMLLEIDRERVLRSDSEKRATVLSEDLAATKQQAAARDATYAGEIGELKGSLAAAMVLTAKKEAEVIQLRDEMARLIREASRITTELATAREHIATLEKAAADVRTKKSNHAKLKNS